MSSHFIAHPVTPDMGLRESINAMLSHVAWASNFGYRADCVHASNYRSLLRDFGGDSEYGTPALIEEHYEHHTHVLRVVPRIPAGFSTHFADLVETLVALCNDYPLYDEQDHSQLEEERALEAIEESREESDPPAHAILSALYDMNVHPVHEPDGHVYIRLDDFRDAVALAIQSTTETAGV